MNRPPEQGVCWKSARRWLFALLAALAGTAPASAEWSCAEAIYASELCPWFGTAADGFAAPTVGMRWSADGYHPGSAAGRWNDGIYVIVHLPRAEAPDTATLWIDIGYEPHWQPHEARALEPVAVMLRLGEAQWRADMPQPLPTPGNIRSLADMLEDSLYRFTFDADVVAAMLAAGDAGPASYNALHGEHPRGLRSA